MAYFETLINLCYIFCQAQHCSFIIRNNFRIWIVGPGVLLLIKTNSRSKIFHVWHFHIFWSKQQLFLMLIITLSFYVSELHNFFSEEATRPHL
jgi:hypothetical protein